MELWECEASDRERRGEQRVRLTRDVFCRGTASNDRNCQPGYAEVQLWGDIPEPARGHARGFLLKLQNLHVRSAGDFRVFRLALKLRELRWL
jgi:hypothetical protein